MKKTLKFALAMLIAVALASCNPQGSVTAGSATAKSMLQLLPAGARGVLVVDVHRAMETDGAQQMLKDENAKKKYDEFVKQSGIDPMKDLYFFVLGLTSTPMGKEPDGAVILNLKYNKADLLARLKGIAKDVQEETYNGVTIYKGFEHEASGNGPEGAFLDGSNIVLGTPSAVKAVIDVSQKKAESLLKSAEMAKPLKAVNMSAMVWGAFAVPPELVKKAVEANPMLKVLDGITGLTMSFDYANKNLVAEIQSLGGTKEQNSQLASMLNGLKAMGSAAASKLPFQGELLNTIEISSGDDHVKIYASVPGELLDKVRDMAKEKFGSMMPWGPPPSKEAQKEEKKEGAEIKK
jgi:hypothetical protein